MGNMIYSKEALSGLIRSDKSKLLDEELAGLKTDRYLRIAFAVFIYLGVMAYIGFVIHLIYKHGEFNMFVLDNSVLITLLTTTTANVVALLVIVAKYLFPHKKQ